MRSGVAWPLRWLWRCVGKVRQLVFGWVFVPPEYQPSEEFFMTISPIKTLRNFSRVPFSAEVELHLQERVIKVQLVDIALKGALVKTSAWHAWVPQEACRLVLPLADGGESIEMSGKVAHLEGEHVGIECLSIDVNSLTQLRRLIELNTGDAELADRELAHLFAPRNPA